jgi:hypothetical protein
MLNRVGNIACYNEADGCAGDRVAVGRVPDEGQVFVDGPGKESAITKSQG